MDLEAEELLKNCFGFSCFRDGQADIVSSLRESKDTLVVMPTGGGKSICYQVPALLQKGVAIVISPLIALMQDQVEALQKKGIAAGLLNSLQSLQQQQQTINQVRSGQLKLLYVAPERLRNHYFLSVLETLNVSLIAVDEAHCLSQWGHDFRPDYLQIGNFSQRVGRPVIGAFTATATEMVRQDIIASLQLRNPQIFISGFNRPNLKLSVLPVDKVAEKYAHLSRLINQKNTGIIYCSTRKRVDQVAEQLVAWDISHIAYHAGMTDTQRNYGLQKFVDRQVDIAVATNAFGMGIDRGDIRFVAHFDMPGSVEAYYQEVGRAGRDGSSSLCEMYFNYADKRVQDFFVEGRNPTPSFIRETYGLLLEQKDPHHIVQQSIEELAEKMGKGTNAMAFSTAIKILAKSGYIERFDLLGSRIRGTRILQPDLSSLRLTLDEVALGEKRDRDQQKVKKMLEFIYTSQSRHRWIMDYFGEKIDLNSKKEWGLCDNLEKIENRSLGNDAQKLLLRKCLSGVARLSHRTAAGWHPRFGKGKIIQHLLGKNKKDFNQRGLTKISTYALLQDQEDSILRALFHSMEEAQLVYTTGEEYPLLTLTDLGEKVMREELTVPLNWSSPQPNLPIEKRSVKAKIKTPLSEIDYDYGLCNALKKKRREMAAATGKKAYQILTNQSIEDLARKKPRNLEEARFIKGVGDFKLKRIIPTFLEVINQR